MCEYERQRHSGLEQVKNLPGLHQGVHGGYRVAAAFVSFGCDVVVANQTGAEQLELCVVGPAALHLPVLSQGIRADIQETSIRTGRRSLSPVPLRNLGTR